MLVNFTEILKKAQNGGYAVGLFNTTDTDMLQAVIEAAEEMRSPVIIGTAEILLPYGELELIAPALIAAARRASVPVAVHYDHGLTFGRCMEALRLGFSSVMYDGSEQSAAENTEATREIVKIAHAFGATAEGEIGHVGKASEAEHLSEDSYTTAEEAAAFCKETGVDALAVSVGTAHGVYKSRPKLSFSRLKEIRAAVGTPLVLHGGSGLSDEDFRAVIHSGIAKINIFTDLCLAASAALERGGREGMDYLELRNHKVRAIRETVMKKIVLFGSDGRA